jgi:hypothetical protein
MGRFTPPLELELAYILPTRVEGIKRYAKWLVVQLGKHGNERGGKPKDALYQRLVVYVLCVLAVHDRC